MPTILEVARRAAVSPATVSRVLTGKAGVRAATRDRVLRAVAELGFVPNGVARGLVTRQTHTLALTIPDITNPFFAGLARGAGDAAQAAGFTLVLGNSDGSAEKEAAFISVALARRVDGMIVASTGLPSPRLRALLESQRTPFVLVGRGLPGLRSDWVRINNVAGAREATEHLLRLGHRRIGLLNGPAAIVTSHEREQGYREALAAAGVPFRPELVAQGDFAFAAGLAAADRLLATQPEVTAIFATNDLMALGAIEAARRQGRPVPDDLSIVGFDDIPVAALVTPRLTTVAVSSYEMGRAAVGLLLERLVGGRSSFKQVIIEPTLVVRESSAPPRPALAARHGPA